MCHMSHVTYGPLVAKHALRRACLAPAVLHVAGDLTLGVGQRCPEPSHARCAPASSSSRLIRSVAIWLMAREAASSSHDSARPWMWVGPCAAAKSINPNPFHSSETLHEAVSCTKTTEPPSRRARQRSASKEAAERGSTLGSVLRGSQYSRRASAVAIKGGHMPGSARMFASGHQAGQHVAAVHSPLAQILPACIHPAQRRRSWGQ